MEEQELELDAAEEQALAELLRAPELSEAEWTALHGAVVSAAAWPLAQRRSVWRKARVRRWLAPAIPLAAAAAVLVMLVGRSGGPVAELTTAEAALLADVTEAEFSALVSGSADAEALLLMAVSDD